MLTIHCIFSEFTAVKVFSASIIHFGLTAVIIKYYIL
jgi:hypothetical protein